MEFVVERKGYYRENEEEEEEEDDDDEDEDGEEIGSSIISKFPFSSSSSSSSSKAYNNNNDYNYKRRQIGDDIDEEVVVGNRCYINMNYKKQGEGGIEGRESRDQLGGDHAQEREHMFDKVVTPSDVGKLNRLVIPKQHAEKYFPLHSSASSSGPEKSGALLDFEDRNGKQWRFRYSYWNSSQSYVMTKGWSRFVKEKKLDAGDIVSFHRSLTTTTTTIPSAAAATDHEELGGGGGGGGRPKYRLFIDWRHRSPIQQHIPVIPPPPPPPHGSSWGYNHHQLTQMMNYNQFQPYFDHHRHSYNYGHQRSATLMGAPAAGSNIYYLTPSQPRLINIMGGSNHHDDDDDDDQTVINSVPVQLLHPMNPPPPPPPHPPTPTSTSTSTSTNSSSASPKRLRLFGVNMEEHCFPIQTDHHHQQQQQQQQQHHVLPSVPYFTNISHLPKEASSSYKVSSTTPPTLLPKSPNTTNTTTTTSSLSFDLHLSDSH